MHGLKWSELMMVVGVKYSGLVVFEYYSVAVVVAVVVGEKSKHLLSQNHDVIKTLSDLLWLIGHHMTPCWLLRYDWMMGH